MIIDTLKKIKLIQQQKSMTQEISLISESQDFLDLEDTKDIISDFLNNGIQQEQRLILSHIQEELKKLEQSIQKHNTSVQLQQSFLQSEIEKLVSSLKNSELFLLSLNISKVKKEELNNFIAKLSELAEQNILLTPNAKTVRLLFEVKDESFTNFDFAKKLSTELVMYSSDLSIQFSKKECSKLIKEHVFTQLLN